MELGGNLLFFYTTSKFKRYRSSPREISKLVAVYMYIQFIRFSYCIYVISWHIDLSTALSNSIWFERLSKILTYSNDVYFLQLFQRKPLFRSRVVGFVLTFLECYFLPPSCWHHFWNFAYWILFVQSIEMISIYLSYQPMYCLGPKVLLENDFTEAFWFTLPCDLLYLFMHFFPVSQIPNYYICIHLLIGHFIHLCHTLKTGSM